MIRKRIAIPVNSITVGYVILAEPIICIGAGSVEIESLLFIYGGWNHG
jgi:hypothetical protein